MAYEMKTSNRSIEIEIQVQIEKSTDLLNFLGKKAKFIGEKQQMDYYYSPANRNFIVVRPVKEWLRLRDSSGKKSINYKCWHYDKDGRSNFCDEFETVIEDIEQAKNIFKALDMKLIVMVDKTRRIYSYMDYEIAFDSIKDLGNFVEIEFKGTIKKKPSDITKGMVEFLKKYNCGKITRNYVGYPFQSLFPTEVKYEEL